MAFSVTNSGSTIVRISTDYIGDITLEPSYNDVTIKEIGANACKRGKLTCLDLRKTQIEIISSDAFIDCISLHQVYFCDSLVSIAKGAFGAAALTSIRITKNLVNFNAGAFNQAPYINAIEVDNENPTFCVKGRCLYRKCNNSLIIAPRNITSTNEIDDFEMITGIEEYAFTCSSLRSFIGTKNLSFLGINSFHVMKNISIVDLSNTMIEIIPRRTFMVCCASKIILPHTIKTIESEAFRNASNLVSLTLNYPVSIIASNAFIQNANLRSIYFLGAANFSHSTIFSDNMHPRIYVTKIYPFNRFGCLPVTRTWPRSTCFQKKRNVSLLFSFYILLSR